MGEAEEIKDKNYEFYINADLSEYAGKWIAIVEGKVVASGDRADTVYDEAKRKYPPCPRLLPLFHPLSQSTSPHIRSNQH